VASEPAADQYPRVGASDDLLETRIEVEWFRVEKLNVLELRVRRVQDVDSFLGDDNRIDAEDGGA
jgi:hypothetical protein